MKKMRLSPVRWCLLLPVLLTLGGCLAANRPQAEFTATPAYAFPPLEVTFDASASSSPNGGIVSYAWEFGDGGTSAGRIVKHTYHEKGVYRVTLTVTDSGGQTGVRTRTVEALNRVPVAQFTFDKSTVGVDQAIRFDASDSYDPDGEIVDYIWAFGDGTTATGRIVEHAYTTAGGSGWRPAITLTVIDDDGASNSITKYVRVVGCDSC